MAENHSIEHSHANQDFNEKYTPGYDEKVQYEEQEDQSQEQNQEQNGGNGELKRDLKARHLQMSKTIIIFFPLKELPTAWKAIG
jgi:amino acid permease